MKDYTLKYAVLCSKVIGTLKGMRLARKIPDEVKPMIDRLIAEYDNLSEEETDELKSLQDETFNSIDSLS